MAEATTTVVPVVATVVVVSHNNKPGLVATVPVDNTPCALPLPTSIGRIGTTAIVMVVMVCRNLQISERGSRWV